MKAAQNINIGQYYIPNINQCIVAYLKVVLSGKKKVSGLFLICLGI